MKADYKADTERVYSLLTDEQFLVDRCIGLGDLEAECDIEEQGDVTVIRLTRKLVRDLPVLLSKLFNPEQTLKLREEWREDEDSEGSRVGKFVIEVRNQPITIFADFRLDPTVEGCRYTIKHKVKSRIPLVGSRVNKYVLRQIEAGCKKQMEYLRNHL
jgi:hypothetical protein